METMQETTALIVKEIDMVFRDWQQVKDKITADQKIKIKELDNFREAYMKLKNAILPKPEA